MKKYLVLLFVLFLAGCTVVEDAPADVSPVVTEENVSLIVKEPEPIAPVIHAGVEDNFSSAKGLHWTHMPVTYSVQNEDECGNYEVRKIIRAFDDISSAANGSVYFEKVKAGGDIVFRCSFLEDCYELVTDIDDDAMLVYRYERICGHTKGLATTSILGNRIIGSEIEIFGLAGFSETSGKGTSGFYIGSCGHPTTEIHEILHAFGYGHSDDNSSIMYYAEDAVGTVIQEKGECLGKRKEIDKDIKDSLVYTYGR